MFSALHRSSSRRLPALFLAILLLAVSLILSLPKPVAAEPGYQTTITFYDDAAHSHKVGVKIFYCNGDWILVGTSSNHYTVDRVPCVAEQPPSEPSFPAPGV